MVRQDARPSRGAFAPYAIATGLLHDDSASAWPSRLHGWTGEGPLRLLGESEAGSAFFGFAQAGECLLRTEANEYRLKAGQYFCANGGIEVGGGQGVVMERRGWRGLGCVGGPLEASGRLRYIDGCTDTLLVAPPRFGDACLNALYFPPETRQTAHTHPSVRMGCVVSGRGECVTPEGRFPLAPGLAFVIEPDGLHSFHTAESPLTVVAYHPDSDFGPRDDDHPMINRTLVS